MQKISILYDASQAVLSTFDLDGVFQQILTIVRDYFHLQNVAILLRDKDDLYVHCQVGWDAGHDEVRLPIGTGITGTAAQQKRPIYAADVSKDVRYILSAKNARSWPYRSWCGMTW
jgi:nitrate/nitrite-specific signal transduction histidine kinase